MRKVEVIVQKGTYTLVYADKGVYHSKGDIPKDRTLTGLTFIDSDEKEHVIIGQGHERIVAVRSNQIGENGETTPRQTLQVYIEGTREYPDMKRGMEKRKVKWGELLRFG